MLLPEHEYKKPNCVSDVISDLGAEGVEVKVMAGGTDVIFNMRNRFFTPDVVLSLSGIDEMRGVKKDDHGNLVIGAGEKLCDLARHPILLQEYPAVAEACRSVASLHVRNMATLGGNICLETRCWYTNQSDTWREARVPCFKTDGDICHVIKSSPNCVAINNSDTPPALIAAGASVTAVSGKGSRTIPLSEFYRDDGIEFTNLKNGEIITAVTLPPARGTMFFYKHTARQGIDFAYAAIAARVVDEGKKAEDITIVLASISTQPIILKDIPKLLAAKGFAEEAIEEACESVRKELGPVNNLFSPSSYKKDLASALLRRALNAIKEANNA